MEVYLPVPIRLTCGGNRTDNCHCSDGARWTRNQRLSDQLRPQSDLYHGLGVPVSRGDSHGVQASVVGRDRTGKIILSPL